MLLQNSMWNAVGKDKYENMFFSDIHGNGAAFDAFLQQMEKELPMWYLIHRKEYSGFNPLHMIVKLWSSRLKNTKKIRRI